MAKSKMRRWRKSSTIAGTPAKSETVQMIVQMSGHRPDGSPWPGAGSVLDLEDWEAEHLVRGEMARPAGDAPVPEPAAEMAADGAEEAAEPPPLAEPPTSTPRAIQPKADWIAWAMVNGLSQDEANALTKAELMERYGSRA